MCGEKLDAIVVPISGGGMASGIALATKAVNPSCKIILVEPEGKMLGKCLKAGNTTGELLSAHWWADIFFLKHESSIFRSVIHPCMWFLNDEKG